MNDGDFTRIGDSNNRLYGSPAILICGYASEEQSELLVILDVLHLTDRPIIFAQADHAGLRVKETFSLPNGTGLGSPSPLRKAIIMSGFTAQDLNLLMTLYQESGLPAPLWGTLTPTAETWALKDLLEELAVEHEAMRRDMEPAD